MINTITTTSSPQVAFKALFQTKVYFDFIGGKCQTETFNTDNIINIAPTPSGDNTRILVKTNNSTHERVRFAPIPYTKFIRSVEEQTGEEIPTLNYEA